MASWILVPCLVQLRAEFNEIAPGRPKASDGSIGDTAHQQETSDHNPDEQGRVPIKDADRTNEVHAIDVTKDLGPNAGGLSMETVVQFLLKRCRSGAEKRLRYIIFNRRIWSASSSWVQKAYSGPSPHTEHAHFSASYTTSLEASTASWHLEDIPVALTAADKTWLAAEIREAVGELTASTALKGADGKPDGTNSTTVGNRVLSQGIPNPFEGGDRSPAYVVIGDIAEAVKSLTTTPPGK